MTTTTTTTVVIVATMQAAITFGIIGTVTLILALIIRELTTAYTGPVKPSFTQRIKLLARGERAKSLSKNVLVAIAPLIMIFALIVAVKVGDVLST